MKKDFNCKEDAFVCKDATGNIMIVYELLVFCGCCYLVALGVSDTLFFILFIVLGGILAYSLAKKFIIGSEEMVISCSGITIKKYDKLKLKTIVMLWEDIDKCFIESAWMGRRGCGNVIKKVFKVRMKNGVIHSIEDCSFTSFEKYRDVVYRYSGRRMFDYESSRNEFEICKNGL